MLIEIFKSDGDYLGRHEFPALPAVGDQLYINVLAPNNQHLAERWCRFEVFRRQIWGYQGELPCFPRVCLYVREL